MHYILWPSTPVRQDKEEKQEEVVEERVVLADARWAVPVGAVVHGDGNHSLHVTHKEYHLKGRPASTNGISRFALCFGL